MITKLKNISRTTWNGIMGIALEVAMTIILVAAGFAVCLFWWGILK